MKNVVSELLCAGFFASIALGGIPLSDPVVARAQTLRSGCDITDVTPGGCELVQWQTAGCHCSFQGICEDSNSCTDAWNAALSTCESVERGGFVVEGFGCVDPDEPPVEFSFSCGPAFGCAAR